MTAVVQPAAGAGSRLAALLLDALLLAALAVLLLVTAVQVGIGVQEAVTDSRMLARAIAASTALTLAPLLCAPLFVVFRVLFDATPGQLLAGVRVVAEDGGRPALWRVLARGPAWLLALLPLGLGVLWMFRDPHRRALHDRLTATRVVEEDESRLSLSLLVRSL